MKMVVSYGVDENNGSDVVISGISGMFASSNNVKEFETNLYNRVNMVNDDESRWPHLNPEIPRFCGKMPQLSNFDATFFGVHQVQADNMDPQTRILIEEAFKAIMDAGVNPLNLRGSNTGVYIGTWHSESEVHLLYDIGVPSGFGITGVSQAMFANRISYVLGLTGPSLLCNSIGSSSLYALDLAFTALRNGEIDSAIVGGSNLCLHPNVTMSFASLGVLTYKGQCCPFDKDADGYIRSEAISCIFLQKRSDAKRIYATVINSRTNCNGFKAEGITYPSSEVQEQLLSELYARANIDLNDLGYIEAHSTGTVIGEPEECRAIDNAICSKRTDPLLIGSVKSNCGNAESAAGMCAIMKVILAMQRNTIAPNINLKNLREDIDCLKEGRLKVVNELTKLPKPYVGINSFGYGGTNAHVLLKQFEKVKANKGGSDQGLPRLVTWSSRTEQNANAFFTDLQNKPLDTEYLALVQAAQAGGVQGMVFRGYTILNPTGDNAKPTVLSTKIEHNPGIKRPLVWVFSGMGSQWTGMGKPLMILPTFSESIQRSHNILKPLGLDLIRIITSDDPNTFDNVLHSFVGIAAIQIALVDILFDLGIDPDYIIGHSVGELGCAYADKCVTAEQVILAAYYRGKVSREIDTIRGSMAAIGIGFQDIKSIVPNSIDVACHNSADSCTISGPAEDVANFVNQLKKTNVFAKEVPCSNIAYHSRYISHFGSELLKYLKRLMPNPKARSSKWISTSVPRDEWSIPENQLCSAEYYTNNLLKSVLFEEAATNIPENALTIEIAPHALLQSILKNAIAEGTHIGLTKRNDPDNFLYFLNALGSLYIAGLEPRIEKLYPEIKWPVSRGTPSLSHLIDFDHSRKYFVVEHRGTENGSGVLSFAVKLEGKHKYLGGHQIDGRVIIPATFYLECIWRTLASLKCITSLDNLPVEFENVKFVRATTLTANDTVELTVIIQSGTGFFEVTESQSLVVSGVVRQITGKTKPQSLPLISEGRDNLVTLQSKDFYKELKLRGYHYNGAFQGVESARCDGLYGKIEWTQNWVTFMDCLLQLSIVGFDTRNLKLPTRIRQMRIYPQCQQSLLGNNDIAEAYLNDNRDTIVCAGVEITGLDFITIQRRKLRSDPILEKYQFVPLSPSPKLSMEDIAKCCIQLVLENESKPKLNIVEFSAEKEDIGFLTSLMHAIGDLPVISGTYLLHHKQKGTSRPNIPNIERIFSDDDLSQTCGDVVVIRSNDSDAMKSVIVQNMDSTGFVIVREKAGLNPGDFISTKGFMHIAFFPSNLETFVLMQKEERTRNTSDAFICKISASDDKFQWVKKLQDAAEKSKDIIVVAQNEQFNGIIGLVNCLRREPTTSTTRCVLIEDSEAPPFDANLALYEKQLKLHLAINVYRKGTWGTYRHLMLSQEYPLTARSDHVYGNIRQLGDFSSLQWLQGPLENEKALVRVVYSSLNFRDVMLASGRLPIDILGESRLDQTCVLGFEYSGVDTRSGKAVMGMAVKAAVSSQLGEQPLLSWEVPQGWSLQEAATVPVVYLTVYYAFFFTADIRKGKSILIHAGSGGIGIAAIRVALAYGLDVYTTVSTQEKKQFLLKTFPALSENNIGNSRDTLFEEMIMDRTKGKGVDFVLNSLSEDKLHTSIRCLARGGHFLEIGKFDMANDNELPLGAFLNELSFHAVLADKLFTADKALVQNLKQSISDDIKRGIIKPLPTTIFHARELERAFRYLMSGKHVGKVLLQIRTDAEAEATLPVTVQPQVYFPADLVFIVAGGVGGFGLELVDWMVLRGARKIVLNSSQGITNDYQRYRIALWKSYSCSVVVNTSDTASASGCKQLLTESMKLGDIGGIFNLALVLRNAIFPNQTSESFQQSFQPKACATKHLDDISRKLCPKLQHFVIFSSVSCGRGNAGQSNYGMSNSVMERIIEDRVAHSLPGKAIQWGAIGEVDIIAEGNEIKPRMEIGGTMPQRISSCLAVLDVLFSSPDPIVSSMMVAEKRVENVVRSPVDAVLSIMSIRDIKSLGSTATTLAELGMDSLTSIEIKQVLEREYDISLSPSELASLSFDKLIENSKTFGNAPAESKIAVLEDFVHIIRQLYSHVDVDAGSANVFERINHVANAAPLIVFTGIEGSSSKIWQDLGSALNHPTYVLQMNSNASAHSLNAMVQYAYQNITNFLREKRTRSFKIIAYSFGTAVAHMITVMLEREGYAGKVVFIDGSVALIEHIFNAVKAVYPEDEMDKFLLSVIVNKVVPSIEQKTIFNELIQRACEGEYLEYTRNVLERNNIKHASKKAEHIDTILKKHKVVTSFGAFKSVRMIQSPLLLLKSSTPLLKSFDENYGLSPFVTNIIHLDDLVGNHETILKNKDLPGILNEYFNH